MNNIRIMTTTTGFNIGVDVYGNLNTGIRVLVRSVIIYTIVFWMPLQSFAVRER